MESLPTFLLFPDPIREEVFQKDGQSCSVCGNARGWIYTAETYGELDDPVVCPWCIHNGAAAKLGITFNDAEQYPSIPSTQQLPADERQLAEERTPGYVTWQGNRWLGCCGKACTYLGEASSADLMGRWSTAMPSMFEDSGWSKDQIDELVSQIEPGVGPCAYVFQCRVCSHLRGYWDCH